MQKRVTTLYSSRSILDAPGRGPRTHCDSLLPVASMLYNGIEVDDAECTEHALKRPKYSNLRLDLKSSVKSGKFIVLSQYTRHYSNKTLTAECEFGHSRVTSTITTVDMRPLLILPVVWQAQICTMFVYISYFTYLI